MKYDLIIYCMRCTDTFDSNLCKTKIQLVVNRMKCDLINYLLVIYANENTIQHKFEKNVQY